MGFSVYNEMLLESVAECEESILNIVNKAQIRTNFVFILVIVLVICSIYMGFLNSTAESADISTE